MPNHKPYTHVRLILDDGIKERYEIRVSTFIEFDSDPGRRAISQKPSQEAGRRTGQGDRQEREDQDRRTGLEALMPWSTPFEDPIELPDGRKLVTLADAAKYIQKLPKAEHDLMVWQNAVEALLMAAAGKGPLMHARIGVLRGLKRDQ